MKRETRALGGDVNEVVDEESLTHQMKQEYAARNRTVFFLMKTALFFHL